MILQQLFTFSLWTLYVTHIETAPANLSSPSTQIISSIILIVRQLRISSPYQYCHPSSRGIIQPWTQDQTRTLLPGARARWRIIQTTEEKDNKISSISIPPLKQIVDLLVGHLRKLISARQNNHPSPKLPNRASKTPVTIAGKIIAVANRRECHQSAVISFDNLSPHPDLPS